MLMFLRGQSHAQENKDSTGKNGIHFCGNLSWYSVIEKAKLEHKYIFVDCFATWCGPCRQMDKEVYPTDSVGTYYNRNFISFKIQCDTSRNDGEETKAAYAFVHRFITQNKIAAYPTFLFFSPDGRLVHKGLGYQEPAVFVSLGQDAMDPSKQYFTLLKDYQSGKRDFGSLPYLAKTATSFNDSATASLIEREYIHKYLNRLPDQEISRRNNLQLLRDFVNELHSSDRCFKWIVENAQVADSVTQKKEFSLGLMVSVKYKEEIKPVLKLAEKNHSIPNWNTMEGKLSVEIGSAGARKAIRKGKLDWYQFNNDWENYYAIVIEIIEGGRLRDNPGNLGNKLALNDAAFSIFQHSSDKSKLEKALSWMDLVLSKMTDSSDFAVDIYDTKAELLYKLARKEEALALEGRAVEIAPRDKSLKEVYKKMQAGQPTW